MPEKIAVGISAAIAVILSTILATWGKLRFVKRSEIFKHDGEPIYRRVVDCHAHQSVCTQRMCAKILELKVGQQDVSKELSSIGRSIARIEQWIKDKNNH